MIRIDKAHEEYWAQSVSYHWRGGSFQLYAYMDRDDGWERAYVTDSGVSYYNFTDVLKLGRVAGTVQRSLRYVSFSALPKTRAQAERVLSVAPDIPPGQLTVRNIRFTGGRRYGVYQGPGEGYGRSGRGKAASCTPNGQPAAAFALYDVTTGQRIATAAAGAAGFHGEGSAAPGVYDLLIVPVDAYGAEDRTQAVSIQR